MPEEWPNIMKVSKFASKMRFMVLEMTLGENSGGGLLPEEHGLKTLNPKLASGSRFQSLQP